MWIPLAAAVALLAAVTTAAVLAQLPEYLISGHRCSDAEAAFAASLGRDPLLTQPPPRVAPIAQQPLPDPFEPCVGNYDGLYYGGAQRGFELPQTTQGLLDTEAHYRNLAAANGWEVSKPKPGELLGRKMVEGTAVVFHLHGLAHMEHNTAYWVELRYAELKSARYLVNPGED